MLCPQGEAHKGTSIFRLASAVFTAALIAAPSANADPDELPPIDATSGPVTVTLPVAPPDGTQVTVKKADISTNSVTVSPGGSDV